MWLCVEFGRGAHGGGGLCSNFPLRSEGEGGESGGAGSVAPLGCKVGTKYHGELVRGMVVVLIVLI